MDIEYITQLIMSSYVLPTKEKIMLISAIKKNEIEKDKLNNIIKQLENIKKEIDWKTDKIINNIKKIQLKNRNKKIPEIKTRTKIIDIQVKEEKAKEKEWNPDNILQSI